MYCRNSLKYCRNFSKNLLLPDKLFFENLSHKRSLIRVSGSGVYEFLQGLITNDVTHIRNNGTNSAIFTMFLNKQGRVLFDTILYKFGNMESTCFIECDRNVENKLKQHLQFFRVRRKICIDIVTELDIWACFKDCTRPFTARDNFNELLPIDEKEMAIRLGNPVFTCVDPRYSGLGFRLIVPSRLSMNDFKCVHKNIECVLSDNVYNYTKHRYVLGIPEGTIEIPSTKCFPFEVNCDYLHGISFHKGCYLGQEFTARTYHTGVIRKRIMPIVIHSPSLKPVSDFDYNTPIVNECGQLVGKLRGSRNEYAIALVKIGMAASSKYLKINDLNVSTQYPDWWADKY